MTLFSFSLCVSAVGGLLQTRFTSGLLSQLPDALRQPPLVAPPATIGPLVQWSTKLTVQPPSSFVLPSPAPEPPIKTVGMRRPGGPVPIKESIAQGKVGLYIMYRLNL